MMRRRGRKGEWMKRLLGLVGGLAMLGGVAARTPAIAQEEPDFLSVSTGAFAVFSRHTAAEFALQYRSDYQFWIFKPHAGVMATTDGGVYGFAGALVDVYFGNRWVLTPSVAVGAYHSGGGKDLGHALEFRSGAELAYRFDARSRLGLGLYHISNADIGDENPGAESALLTYSLPFDKLLGR